MTHSDELGPDPGIGARIRRYRQDRGMSLTELANQAGVSKSHLSVIENGTGSRPGARVLYALATALGVTLADLLGRTLRPADAVDISPSLLEFAARQQLPETDVQMLAGIQFRGEQPQTTERWAYIYNAISTSRQLDDPGQRR
jgi:transcriptional regulator with XRE-family HTH domain